MKFGKYWTEHNDELPKKLQQKTLSYKKWKKTTPEIHSENILQNLTDECTIASNTIIESIKNKKKQSLSCIFNINYQSFDTIQLYQYALLNKQTLYKICKRLDKKFECTQYKTWLQNHYNDFAFNGGMYYTKLYLESNSEYLSGKSSKYSEGSSASELRRIFIESSENECPICLEGMETSGNLPFIITNCGHMICYPCTLLMYNITPMYRGRLSVLIDRRNMDNGNEQCCPVCRSHTFMNKIKYINIWPPTCKKILDKIDHNTT